jgi:hypothetical protein
VKVVTLARIKILLAQDAARYKRDLKTLTRELVELRQARATGLPEFNDEATSQHEQMLIDQRTRNLEQQTRGREMAARVGGLNDAQLKEILKMLEDRWEPRAQGNETT